MNPQAVSLKPDKVFHNLKLLNSSKQRFGIFESSTSVFSSVQNNNLSIECLNTACPFKEKIATSEDEFGKFNFKFQRHNSELKAEVSSSDNSVRLDTRNNPSAEFDEANLPLKKETGKLESTIPTSGFTEKSYDGDSSRSLCDNCIYRNSELLKDIQAIYDFGAEKDLQENKCAEEKFTKFVAKCNVDNFQKSLSLKLQNEKSSDEYGSSQTLVQSVQSKEYENLVTQNRYVQNDVRPEISDRLDKFPNNEDYFEHSFLGNYPIGTKHYLQKLEESEISEENIPVIENDRVENALLKEPCFEINVDTPNHESSQCNSQEDVFLLEYLCSVFDFLPENSEVTNYFNEDRNVCISTQRVENEDEVSKSFCVQSVKFLLSCLNQLEKDLMVKQNKAFQLKIYFETSAKKLVSNYSLKKTKDDMSNELQDLVNNCDNLLEDLEKDRVECAANSEKIQNILSFLQINCLKPNL